MRKSNGVYSRKVPSISYTNLTVRRPSSGHSASHSNNLDSCVTFKRTDRRCKMPSLRTSVPGMELCSMPEVKSTVFVVDDDISVRESLELLIRSEGHKVETF